MLRDLGMNKKEHWHRRMEKLYKIVAIKNKRVVISNTNLYANKKNFSVIEVRE